MLTWYRQIRNAFQTAVALAEFEAHGEEAGGTKQDPELTERHFQRVADASQEFDNYLRSTLGGQTDADVARLEQTRVDDFQKLVERLEEGQKAQKSKAKRRGKIEFDSEDSEPLDSEDSDDDSDESKSSSSESSEEEPVKPVKSKKDGKSKKSRHRD